MSLPKCQDGLINRVQPDSPDPQIIDSQTTPHPFPATSGTKAAARYISLEIYSLQDLKDLHLEIKSYAEWA